MLPGGRAFLRAGRRAQKPEWARRSTSTAGLITDGARFFSEEKRHCRFENESLEPGVPVYELTNTENQGRYKIYKEVFSDPYRNVVVQKIRFEPLEGKLADFRLYALLAPHLANCGAGNTGWIGDYKGVPMLFAEHTDTALAFPQVIW